LGTFYKFQTIFSAFSAPHMKLWRIGTLFVILALLQVACGLNDDQSESHDASFAFCFGNCL
jgi:hypothetical protein